MNSLLKLTPLDVRRTLPDSAYRYSTWLGTTLFVAVSSLYASLLLAGLYAENLILKAILGVLTGQAIGILFVIGHDAAHGSLTNRPILDRLFATLAFLPSLHPVSTWKVEHNKMHHGWTNLKGMDPVYPPMSPDEFRRLSTWQKRVHRFYRSVWGFGCYYLFDIWWKLLIRGQSDHGKIPAAVVICDALSLCAFLALQLVLCRHFADDVPGLIWNILLNVMLPFVVWNYVMTFVTIQNHTHPDIRWYDNREEWSYFRAQVAGSIHTEVPAWMDFSFARVFQHTAHHVDKKIPLYRLVNVQASLESSFPSNVKRVRLTWKEFRKILYECQAYDYRQHVWLPFSSCLPE